VQSGRVPREREGYPQIAPFAMCGVSPQMEYVQTTVKPLWLGVLNS